MAGKKDQPGTAYKPDKGPAFVARPDGQTHHVGHDGPSVKMVSSERQMKPYTIFETEILSITKSSALASIFFSFGTGLASYAFKTYFETDGPGAEMYIAGSVVLAAICFAVGVWANAWRNATVRQIRKESGEADAETSKLWFVF